eukprot:CFRG5921T1
MTEPSSAVKVLVVGDVDGQFNAFFKRVESVNRKAGPFDAVFCTGSFFAREGSSTNSTESSDEWMSYQEGTKRVPLPIYILGPVDHTQLNYYASVLEGGDVCDEVHFLGRQGVFTTLEGLRVAFLSGTYDALAFDSLPHSLDEQRTSYVTKDCTALIEKSRETGYAGVDLLLTSDWPKDVYRYTQEDKEDIAGESKSVQIIADVAKAVKPRYHFAGLHGVHYERAPYDNFVPRNPFPVTRFVGLAVFGNKEKNKAMYAFTITPMLKSKREDLLVKPQGTTPCPYEAGVHTSRIDKRGQSDVGNDGNMSFFYGDQGSRKRARSEYVCRLCNVAGHHIRDCTLAGQKKPNLGDVLVDGALPSQQQLMQQHGVGVVGGRRRVQQPPTQCWFCLSSPEVEKHLVMSVGTELYIAYAKGHLVDEHVLILPITHVDSTLNLTKSAKAELEQHKKALKTYYKETQDKNVVFFERSYVSRHLQVQAIPIPSSISTQAVKDAFEKHGNQSGFPFEDINVDYGAGEGNEDENTGKHKGFFLVEFEDGSQLLHKHVNGEAKFPLQFGREVLGSKSIWNLPDRIDWKACKVSLEEETANVLAMRKGYDKYAVE